MLVRAEVALAVAARAAVVHVPLLVDHHRRQAGAVGGVHVGDRACQIRGRLRVGEALGPEVVVAEAAPVVG